MYRACCLLSLALLAACSGCAVCSTCNDDTYATYGGKWQRTDMLQGRVGSAFNDAGFVTSEVVSDSEELPSTPAEIDGDPVAIAVEDPTHSVLR